MGGLKSSIVRLTPMYRRILAFVLCAILFAAGYRFLVMPQSGLVLAEKKNQMRIKLESQSKYTQIKALEEDIAAHVPVTPAHRAKLDSTGRKLFTKSSIESFFGRLPSLASAAGLGGFTATEDPAASGQAVVGIPTPVGSTEYITVKTMAVAMKFRCGYGGLSKFAQILRNEGRYIKLSNLKISTVDFSGNLEVEAVYHLYYEGN